MRALISETYHFPIFSCACHSLNLCGVHAVKWCPIVITSFDGNCNICLFLRYGTFWIKTDRFISWPRRWCARNKAENIEEKYVSSKQEHWVDLFILCNLFLMCTWHDLWYKGVYRPWILRSSICQKTGIRASRQKNKAK